MSRTAFNPRRLTQARTRRGYSKAALARDLGLSTRILTAYESGEKSPSVESLERLATQLDFPVDFFRAGDPIILSPEAVSFRSLKSLTAGQRDAALGAAALALDLAAFLDKEFELPPVDLPILTGKHPESAAEEIRALWGLGDKAISQMVGLLERRGVRVFSLVEDCRAVDAFSFWQGNTPYVLLNTTKSAEHSRLDAAHELGHLVLHRNGKRGREAEHEAMRFGSALLMPREPLLHSGLVSPSLEQLIRYKRPWGVSLAALVYRLHALDIISEWHYRSLMVELSQRGHRRKEPEPIDRESSELLRIVLNKLRQEGKSRQALAQELRISRRELDRLVFRLVPTPVARS
jgi:Zn-dependent peptidase ImmA (M78 family)/DNA-binding XRE family transcriptional regulator